jgi:rRNA maturation endonuclease Nob1
MKRRLKMKNTSGEIISNKKKMRLREKSNITRARSKKRLCLKCGKRFLSKGPYNRVCERCGLLNERMATSTYSIGDTSPGKSGILEDRFYELN